MVSSNSHAGVVHRIEASLIGFPNPKPKLHAILAQNLTPEILSASPCLMVAVGAQALEAVLKINTPIPTLSVLCHKNTYHTLLNAHHSPHSRARITAIYLDQPLKRQLDLIQALFGPHKKHIGVLFGPHSFDEQENLEMLTKEAQLSLTSIYVNKFENPVAVLDALNDATVLLALPDSRIYNPTTARGILLTTFHKRVPLIGYSNTFVNNGALAAVYTPSKQLADQTAAKIFQLLHCDPKKPFPAPDYPSEFAVAVNYHVARSLGIKIESETALKQAIIQREYKRD